MGTKGRGDSEVPGTVQKEGKASSCRATCQPLRHLAPALGCNRGRENAAWAVRTTQGLEVVVCRSPGSTEFIILPRLAGLESVGTECLGHDHRRTMTVASGSGGVRAEAAVVGGALTLAPLWHGPKGGCIGTSRGEEAWGGTGGHWPGQHSPPLPPSQPICATNWSDACYFSPVDDPGLSQCHRVSCVIYVRAKVPPTPRVWVHSLPIPACNCSRELRSLG